MDPSSLGSQYTLGNAQPFRETRIIRDRSFANESFALPFLLSIFFIAVQLAHILIKQAKKSWIRLSRDSRDSRLESLTIKIPNQPGTFQYLFSSTRDRNGLIIFGYAMARLLGCFCLVLMSAKTLMECSNIDHWQLGFAARLKNIFVDCPEIFMTLTYLYSFSLAVISMAVPPWTTYGNRYNIAILLSATAVYVYRDIWPLATYTKTPKDSQDAFLWSKVAILSFVSLLVPLFVPRYYIPLDPKDPMPVPNDEQTCSLISLIFYSYLDPVILLGYRVAHVKADQLPPLSDTDYSRNLVEKAFPHLDPYRGAKKKHLFFGLMRVFCTEYAVLAFCIVGQVILKFLSPIGINRILTYLERGEAGLTVRPWFWILCLFVAPTFSGLLSQWYVFIASRAHAHAEALITQLVFEHSLRIRLVAEGQEANQDAVQSTPGSASPDTASVAGSAETSLQKDAGAASTAKSGDSGSTLTTPSPSTKGKSREPSTSSDGTTKPASKAQVGKESRGKKESNLVGKINNLVTTDLGNIMDARNFLYLVLSVPLLICGSIVFLYQLLGWSAFVGLAVMIALFPLPGYTSKLLQGVQKRRMKMTDARVQDITEVVGVLRMVKLFGWEEKVSKRIKARREEELSAAWKFKVLTALNGALTSIIPTVIMVATYAVYTTIMKQSLTPSVVFSTMTVFSILRGQLFTISMLISITIQGKVSLDRVSDFLQTTELLDSFSDDKAGALNAIDTPFDQDHEIGFRNATFSWRVESDVGTRRSFRLRIDELLFKSNCINLIVGPTGSGKTSVLMALLGEMHFVKTTPDSWFNLPRKAGIAYAAQESWVQNDTIRQNILFESAYDETRYRKVIQQCALEKDLELFEAGDATEVGEKGVTLSGGQKARVTLARAIYSEAKIVLLDDIFAALDVHTSTWIVDRCLRGDLMNDRTILLVTHNVALVAPIAGFIVSLSHDGTVAAQGTDYRNILEDDLTFIKEMERTRQEVEIASQEVPSLTPTKKETPANGKLVVAEEIAQGHVTWKAFKMFLAALGGDRPLVFFSLLLAGLIGTNVFGTFQTWFLGYWASKYEDHDQADVKVSLYLSLYSVIVIGTMSFNIASSIYYLYANMRASRVINATLVDSVLTSTLRWLDETPTSRIIARCTQDIRALDNSLPQGFQILLRITLQIVTNLGVIIIFTPIFLFPGLAVAALGFYIGNVYLKAQMSVKREMSNARAPVLAHFGSTMSGIVSVRAYGAQKPVKKESLNRIDRYMRIQRMSYNLNRWIAVRVDLLGTSFSAGLASYLVYGTFIGASNTGFSLSLVVEFCTSILFWVRWFNDFEVESNSLERIRSYIDIEHEPPATEEGKPPAAWPTNGEIVVENLSARYSQKGPAILHNLSFRIESGQRVGVVGRTGSGKSSLTLALMRCILTEGTVYYDGIPTNKVNLDALRSNITIIPQTPELISGTLRRNLDPFEQHNDAVLNDALRSAGLFSVHNDAADGRITLDSNISAGGSNISVGEKQIIALARAMVRGSKLLILDEATSAIDYKTDSVIQTTLRQKLDSGVTVITVAHRLQTIMDADKIMVLDEGKITEFDSPKALLLKEKGMFKALVDQSGDKATLYAMAEEKTVLGLLSNSAV